MRYIKENTSKLKDIPGSWAGRIKTVKTSILLCTTDLMQFLSKLQWQFSEKQKKNPKIHIEPQRSQIVKVILRRKIRTRSIMFPIFKLHYETKAIKPYETAIKTDTQINGIEESPEIELPISMLNLFITQMPRDFPGGPVAKFLCSQCRGLGLIPGQGIKSHVPQLRVCMPQLKILCATEKIRHK